MPHTTRPAWAAARRTMDGRIGFGFFGSEATKYHSRFGNGNYLDSIAVGIIFSVWRGAERQVTRRRHGAGGACDLRTYKRRSCSCRRISALFASRSPGEFAMRYFIGLI